ncbi:unnamed protein product, partial [Porites evermanni]
LYWTKDHDLLLVREVLTVDPYSQPKGSRERGNLSEPRFSVSVRSVRDRVNLVLIKKHKRKVAEERKASGIAVDEPSEFDAATEEICEKAEAAEREREQQMISAGKKAKAEKEKRTSRGYESQGFGESWRNKKKSVRTKETGAVCPSKAARRNDTATDPSTGAAINNQQQHQQLQQLSQMQMTIMEQQ